ncbi:MAG: hypothetical protein WA081_09210, partial [Desulfosalsimonadaceae bacterium]
MTLRAPAFSEFLPTPRKPPAQGAFRIAGRISFVTFLQGCPVKFLHVTWRGFVLLKNSHPESSRLCEARFGFLSAVPER